MHQYYAIQNEQLAIRVRHQGAELASIVDLHTGIEYMWQADPKVWGSHAPVLFPIIGGLKGGQYQYEGQTYSLSKHGMIRHADDLEFEVGPDYIRCRLSANERTRQVYPFDFIFEVSYRLVGRKLIQEHRVINKGATQLPFSLGAHPAFRLPVLDGEVYEDYSLRFEHFETAPSYQVDENGLIASSLRPGLQGWELALKPALFAQDALVLRNHRSRRIAIVHRTHGERLSVSFPGWPYLGIWAKPTGDFVCIEPWLGLSDTTDSSGNLLDKEGIILLPPQEVFHADYEIELA